MISGKVVTVLAAVLAGLALTGCRTNVDATVAVSQLYGGPEYADAKWDIPVAVKVDAASDKDCGDLTTSLRDIFGSSDPITNEYVMSFDHHEFVRCGLGFFDNGVKWLRTKPSLPFEGDYKDALYRFVATPAAEGSYNMDLLLNQGKLESVAKRITALPLAKRRAVPGRPPVAFSMLMFNDTTAPAYFCMPAGSSPGAAPNSEAALIIAPGGSYAITLHPDDTEMLMSEATIRLFRFVPAPRTPMENEALPSKLCDTDVRS